MLSLCAKIAQPSNSSLAVPRPSDVSKVVQNGGGRPFPCQRSSPPLIASFALVVPWGPEAQHTWAEYKSQDPPKLEI